MKPEDRKRLELAVDLLENPSWAARITNFIGMPVEWAIKKLPDSAGATISKATTAAIKKAIIFAVSTMSHRYRGPASTWWHKSSVALSGGVGGFFGLPGLIIDLPISTVLIMRSIADIARSEGENISSVDTQLSCLYVFALGGRKPTDDAVETAYYGIRTALAKAISEASEFIARKGLIEEGAPVIVRLIARIAARFDLVVTEKVAAAMVPIIGAVGGATINLLFIKHFQSMARGHFIIRSLERQYGQEFVRQQYEAVAGRK
ncbi:MAG: peptidase [Candidatus Fischerbacteria bacterium RBG_13_37_8]|uniref:Peptidase n=1 Tax=Candidatus Fischerbacteria bacterium RBG_13_37_8 TaxID=1817863 RepID=A0A1F5VL67_9BACT|nr:MAG: peptidase [Candidatus Fischerbacteria bacterium RBG_13_37_8]